MSILSVRLIQVIFCNGNFRRMELFRMNRFRRPRGCGHPHHWDYGSTRYQHNQPMVDFSHVEIGTDLCTIMFNGFGRWDNVALPVDHDQWNAARIKAMLGDRCVSPT
jgi:hypothetical protein